MKQVTKIFIALLCVLDVFGASNLYAASSVCTTQRNGKHLVVIGKMDKKTGVRVSPNSVPANIKYKSNYLIQRSNNVEVLKCVSGDQQHSEKDFSRCATNANLSGCKTAYMYGMKVHICAGAIKLADNIYEFSSDSSKMCRSCAENETLKSGKCVVTKCNYRGKYYNPGDLITEGNCSSFASEYDYIYNVNDPKVHDKLASLTTLKCQVTCHTTIQTGAAVAVATIKECPAGKNGQPYNSANKYKPALPGYKDCVKGAVQTSSNTKKTSTSSGSSNQQNAQQECEKKGGRYYWDPKTKKCKDVADVELDDDLLMNPEVTKDELECRDKIGAMWNIDTQTCECRNPKQILKDNKCVNIDEVIADIEFDGDLINTPEITKDESECRKKTGTIWNAKTETCECIDSNQKLQGNQCIDKTKEELRQDKQTAAKEERQQKRDEKAEQLEKYHQEKCAKGAAHWDGEKCVCNYEGEEWSNTQSRCILKDYCKEADKNAYLDHQKNKCVCKDSKKKWSEEEKKCVIDEAKAELKKQQQADAKAEREKKQAENQAKREETKQQRQNDKEAKQQQKAADKEAKDKQKAEDKATREQQQADAKANKEKCDIPNALTTRRDGDVCKVVSCKLGYQKGNNDTACFKKEKADKETKDDQKAADKEARDKKKAEDKATREQKKTDNKNARQQKKEAAKTEREQKAQNECKKKGEDYFWNEKTGKCVWVGGIYRQPIEEEESDDKDIENLKNECAKKGEEYFWDEKTNKCKYVGDIDFDDSLLDDEDESDDEDNEATDDENNNSKSKKTGVKKGNNENDDDDESYDADEDEEEPVYEVDPEKLEEKRLVYEDARATEQSKENRLLTAATTAATGIGGMELAQGLAEQNADKNAEKSMDAYIATMRCKYAGGKQVKASTEEIELPGGNDETLMKYRNEYFTLAADLKERKEALGMKPGIESEEILDKSQMGLYDDENIGITDGAYSSLYRAKMLNSEKDKKQIEEEKEKSNNRVTGGATALGVGIVGGILGDQMINGSLGSKNYRNMSSTEFENWVNQQELSQNKLTDIQSCFDDNYDSMSFDTLTGDCE